jgi:hypothetical protein
LACIEEMVHERITIDPGQGGGEVADLILY